MKKITTARKKKMTPILNEDELDDMAYSDEYAEYIMKNSGGIRVICNGDTLLEAMEDGFLFDDFIDSLN